MRSLDIIVVKRKVKKKKRPAKHNFYFQAYALVIVTAMVINFSPWQVFGDEVVSDLGVEKTVDNPTPYEGGQIVYTISVTNYGRRGAGEVFVRDVFPLGLTYSSSIASVGSYSTSTDEWIIGKLGSGASASLEISALVDSGTAGQTITNTATVHGLGVDGNSSNNTDSVDIVPQVPPPSIETDLSIEKTVDNAVPFENQTVTFKLVATNNGPDAATGVIVTDQIPQGLNYLTSNPSQGTYSTSTSEWLVGNLGSNASSTLELSALVNPGTAGQTITNTASVDGDQADNNPQNNTSSSSIVPEAARAFTLTVHLTGDGEGIVTDEDGKIDCDSEDSQSDCTETYATSTPVTLTATAKPGSTFEDSWFDACGSFGSTPVCTLDITSDTQVTAHFDVVQSIPPAPSPTPPPPTPTPSPVPPPSDIGPTGGGGGSFNPVTSFSNSTSGTNPPSGGQTQEGEVLGETTTIVAPQAEPKVAGAQTLPRTGPETGDLFIMFLTVLGIAAYPEQKKSKIRVRRRNTSPRRTTKII